MKTINNFSKGGLAGICIGLGGTIYLKVGGVAGACLFAFGLIAVISLGLNLFTGKAQFVWSPRANDYGWLAGILGLNIVGCLAVALAVSTPAIQDSAINVINGRLTIYSPLRRYRMPQKANGCRSSSASRHSYFVPCPTAWQTLSISAHCPPTISLNMQAK